jgi:hypothetical protein
VIFTLAVTGVTLITLFVGWTFVLFVRMAFTGSGYVGKHRELPVPSLHARGKIAGFPPLRAPIIGRSADDARTADAPERANSPDRITPSQIALPQSTDLRPLAGRTPFR